MDMLIQLNELLGSIDNVLWGWVMAFILLATGIVFSAVLRFPQIRYFKKMFQTMDLGGKKDSDDKKAISGFAALCAAVGGQVGTGSLVGVASALAAGGPGALFWMWVTALVGMSTSFAEAVLGLVYRETAADGTHYGGAHYYMAAGLRSKIRPILYAVITVFTIGFAMTMIQNNSISSAVTNVIDIPLFVPGLIVTALSAVIAFGGAKKMTDLASLIVPFMATFYILVTLFIVVTHISALPGMFATVLKCAFTGQAAAGGAVGYTVQMAFRQGIARGLFSNDAGNGCHSSMHATAVVSHPAKQGFAAMLGTFLTTIIICSCTGFAILLTGVLSTDLTGINLVQEAFAESTGVIGRWIVLLAMTLFGFTTLIANIFYGEVSVRYLFKKNQDIIVAAYKVVALILIFLGSVISLDALWNMVDFFTAMMIVVNAPSMLQLIGKVKNVLLDYEKQVREGKTEPVWKEN